MSYLSRLDAAGVTPEAMAAYLQDHPGTGFDEALRAIGKGEEMDRESFRKSLIDAVGGCDIQHDGWPCSSCFRALKLDLTHPIRDYWEAVLAYRGDYPELPERLDLLNELKSVIA
jgi:hypothetical protein